MLGGIEAGGTKMVLGIGDENCKILDTISIPTLTPDETTPRIIEYFADKGISALGVASFGPLDLNAASPTYGCIAASPKLTWRHYPLLPTLGEALCVPMGLDTDVNAAALAEVRLGAAKGLDSCLYVTVGTGIGGGLLCEGRLVHGLQHPEWGHIPLRPRADDPAPKGFCPYHESCLEGLASGPAIEKRWGKSAKLLPPDHPAWALEAHYLAQLCQAALMAVSPKRIILGGGVMGQPQLLPLVRAETTRLLGGYLTAPGIENMDELITAPGLYPDSGLIGALLLAKDAMA